MIDRKKYMDEKEIKQLIKAVKSWHDADLYKGRIQGPKTWMLVDVALSTGLRVSELVNLKVSDIDFKRKALSVVRLKKRKKVVETLAVPDSLIAHLRQYLDGRTDGYLFVGKRGPLKKGGLQIIWKQAIKRAGLPKDLSIHTARHSMGFHLLKKTKNLRQVQKQLGHTSPAMTANFYADVSFDEMQSGVNGLYAENEDSPAP
ncbi:MAG: phage integrase family protein [Planctomycetes bacterium]|nr:phage integrase family protein [Planctomycetota bacterium]